MPPEGIPVLDMMNRRVLVPTFPQRIISLVPSQTELLFDLGMAKRIVGVTKFCIHPENQVKNIAKIGGTKNFNFELINQLNPDLIIGNKEENYEEGIKQLSQKHPVWMSDIFKLEDALTMIAEVGTLVSAADKATEMATHIQREFALLDKFTNLSAVYFIWRKPYMVAGKNTFIQDMLQRMGLQNVFLKKESRYPEISLEELQAANPEVILLSSEPYPFSEKHISELRNVLPDAQVVLVDGELFSWYGSRLLKSIGYLRALQQQLQLR